MLLIALLPLLFFGQVVSTPPPPRPQLPLQQVPQTQTRRTRTDSITIPPHFYSYQASDRSLQYNASACSICRGARVIADRVPTLPPEDIEEAENITCGELEEFAQFLSPEECQDLGLRLVYWECCDGQVPLYQCESNIRQQILTNYDTAVPPIPSTQSALNVSVTLESHSVEHIDVQAGTAKILISLLLVWQDDRLKWEQDKDTCAGFVSVWAGQDPQITNIWVPDLDLYNQVEGFQTMPNTQAIVYSDGTVEWNRIGGITAFCQFSGLSQIPFDILGCQFIVGPWVRQNTDLIQYDLANGTGLIQGRFKATFNEYLPVPELAESGRAFGGAVMYFNLFYQRSQKYYVNNLLIPTIILTYVSMGTFLLDLRVGERLSYGMALALVVVAQQIATGGLIPVSNERLWIDKFIGWSFYWVIVGLVESVCIGYLYFLREDKLAKLTDEGDAVYDGMRESAFVHPPEDSLPDYDEDTTQGGHANEIPLQEQSTSEHHTTALDELNDGVVDCDNYASYLEARQQTQAKRVSIVSVSGHHHHGPSSRRYTLKQQLQHRHSTHRISSGSSVKHEENPFGPRPLHWMYTVSLRQIDRFFFFFTLATYTLFVIAMFVSRPYWGMNLPNVWLNETATSWDNLLQL